MKKIKSFKFVILCIGIIGIIVIAALNGEKEKNPQRLEKSVESTQVITENATKIPTLTVSPALTVSPTPTPENTTTPTPIVSLTPVPSTTERVETEESVKTEEKDIEPPTEKKVEKSQSITASDGEIIVSPGDDNSQSESVNKAIPDASDNNVELPLVIAGE